MGWSDTQNQELFSAVMAYSAGRQNLVQWRLIQRLFPGRSWSAVYSHFIYHVQPKVLDKFNKFEDQHITNAMKAQLSDDEMCLMLGYRRKRMQIVRRKQILMRLMNQDPPVPVQRFSRSLQLSHQLVSTIISLRRFKDHPSHAAGEDVEKQLMDLLAEDQKCQQRAKKTGRPPKASVSMEDELRSMVRPLMIINTKRARLSSYPGDGREHGKVLAMLHRFLHCQLDARLMPPADSDEQKLLDAGIQLQDHDALKILLHMVPQLQLSTRIDRLIPARLAVILSFCHKILHSSGLHGLFGRLVLKIFNAQLTVSKEKGGRKEKGEEPEAVAKHGTGMWNGKRERKRKGEKERMKERE